MLNVICVRHGTKYSADYVTKLHAMVARNITLGTEGRFICFTDQPDELPGHIITKPLPEGVAGWWCKLWLFSAGLFDEGDRVLFFDLDTVIVGDLDAIAKYDGEFAILQDFYRPQGWQSAVMAWRAGFGAHIWENWVAAGRPEVEGGDQAWIEECQRPIGHTWQNLFPGLFCSYKVHCHPFPPDGASVVVFHGEPRPDNCGRPWVDAIWSEGDTGHFQLAMIANVGLDQIREQSRLSAARGFARLTSKPGHDRPIVIVGGGPSLRDPITMAELRRRIAEGCAVWALNGTYEWLAGQGISADAFVILDARAENAKFALGVSPQATAYVASQCHPDVYDALSPDQIIRFDLDIMGDCGTTVGTHAILIAFVEGYREIHLYGFDSSYRDSEGHAYKQDLNSSERIVDAHVGNRVFRAAPWMVRQAQDFETIARDVAAAGGSIIVHGDGLLPEMARILANPEPMGPEIRAKEVLSRLEMSNPTGAEIGVFGADMSCHLLARDDLTLFMVDAWEGGGASYHGDSGDWHAGLAQEKQDAYCDLARSRVAFAGERARIIRARSVDAAAQIADASLDFVFIDADHGYEGCSADIAAWWPKVKAGGLVGGHDYENTDFPKFGVTRAVNEFATSIGQVVDLGDNFTWFLTRT
jgi:hypothetical protein